MPYIKPEQRAYVSEREMPIAETAGELNYLISRDVSRYVKQKGLSYQTFNDILGALRCVEIEIARRFIAPYEDRKLMDNGEVFGEIVEEMKKPAAPPR